MRVAVLYGGRSSEHDVSLASGASVREGVAAPWTVALGPATAIEHPFGVLQ